MARHHYIPQFYLRQWADDDQKLSRFSRPYREVVHDRVFPIETGWAEDLYKLENVPAEVKQYIENVFLKIADQQAHDAMKELLAGNLNTLSHKLKCGWVRFIISLINRTPNRVAMIREKHAALMAGMMTQLEQSYDLDHAADVIMPSPEMREADIKARVGISVGKVLQRSMDLPQVGLHIMNMHWGVYTIPIRRQFLLTSDRPAHIQGGLSDPKCILSIPMSPNQLFIAVNERSYLREIQKRQPAMLVRQSNETVTARAENCVYGVEEDAIRYVRRHSDLKPIKK